MKILFIQLSDIHFKGGENSLLKKADQLFTAISNNTLGVEKILLLITGDIAFSGKKNEYKIASDFLADLILRIEIYSKIDVDTIVIPGNHDCDFSDSSRVRETIIKTIQTSGEDIIDNSVIDVLTEPQKEYFEFAKAFNSKKGLIYESKLLNIWKHTIKEKNIICNCINTSYISQLYEKPGQMLVPINYLGYDISTLKADLIVTIFHHPLHWLHPENRREFKNVVEKVSDIYLTGHEHQSTKSLIMDLENNNTLYIEGAVIQDSSESENSGFNLIFFNLEENKFLIKNYQWDNNIYIGQNSNQWVSYERGVSKSKNPYDINKDFKISLNDIGANLSHPNVSQVRLLDIYTFPRIEYINYSEEDVKNRNHFSEDSEALINSLDSNIRLSFLGPENIGKSAMMKIIFFKLHSKGLVPILVEGKRINETNIDDFITLTLDCFSKQYDSKNNEYLLQLPKEKIVILIDNFDKINFNKKYKGRLLSNLLNHYENIIITGNELMSLEDFLSEDAADSNILNSFKTYSIREFGHLLRSKFINKWITLGNQEMIIDEDRIRKLDNAESIVKTVTGKNLVPNYPIFLLTILQAIELGNPANLTASTFGHYYQFLIQKSFSSILKTQHEITSYNNYICELAYFIFKNKSKILTISKLKKFDSSYRNLYTITPTLDQILENLCAAKILEESDKIYEFKYLYIYYFFVSKYLSDNIDNNETKQTISALIKRIYQAEFANILLFLTHHTKDRYLIEEVLENAKSLFEDISIFKLEPSNKAINNLVTKLPQVAYKPKSVDDHRDEINKQKDEMDDIYSKESDDESFQLPDLEEDITKLDIISHLNLSFKMIEVLGQILKNNYGKISNPKLYDLVEETYLLGLRTLNIFFSALEGNMDVFISQIQSIITEKNLSDPVKIESVSRQILFSIFSEITYGFIKKISDSLGTQHLENTYDAVLSNHSYNSVKLIDFSIKLDHFRQFPNTEMRKLKSEFLKTPLAADIMRRSVLNYLYLFPTAPDQKQRILSFLEIPMDMQRKIDATSPIKKK
ncbi:STAND family AAA ATPase [Runella aurantiaca]|uniref:Uncharacterized protein n=1 Tax=Runella aurantiaca TaxID=2282308 RepID=A0A369IEF3_9BACT|nr:metallophosphoesterase [Runella aurantiaca]RDB05614.1 hypothetical protein DVG78_13640 [Runella aurantiaca]